MTATQHDPLESPKDDKLRRDDMARHIAAEIRSLDTSGGYVLAVMGPWGSGKTTFINFIEAHLQDSDEPINVIDFNPWMFSGSEQLVHVFFNEVAAQLRLKRGRFEQLADDFDAYADLLSPLSAIPFLGAWFDRVRGAGKALKQFKDRRKESVTARRAHLAEKLSDLERPILVVIDDIDRLSTAEIRDMFKLVRLTASFPNVVYILAFDRKRVEQALGEQGVDGRSFLEKIVQHPIDIPAIPDQVMFRRIGEELDLAINSLGHEISVDSGRWPDVFAEIVRPLIRNMRDVHRYAGSVRATLRGLHGQVELADLLAIEAVRVFMPDTFSVAVETQTQAALTQPASFSGGQRYLDEANKAAIDTLLASAGGSREVVVKLIERVFPAAIRHIGGTNYAADWQHEWIQARRLAHPDMLRLYLERTTNAGVVALNDAERAFQLLDDKDALGTLFNEMDGQRQLDTIQALEAYESKYAPAMAVPATTVLLNLLPRLPESESQSFWSMGTDIVVTRVVLRLFRKLGSGAQVRQAVESILPAVPSVHSRLNLVVMIGDIEGAGHNLTDHDTAVEFETRLEQEIATLDPEELAKERDLLRVLLWPRRRDNDVSITLGENQMASAPLIHAILLGAVSARRSQTVGTRAVRVERVLQWEILTALFGSEENLAASLGALQDIDDKDTQFALELADRYLSGWRPERF